MMKYFEPRLYIRFNSSDDEEADRADRDWEEAIRAYRGHLKGLRDRMPDQVSKLADLCLHDAELLAFERPTEPPIPPLTPSTAWLHLAILSVERNGEIVTLIYFLCDQARQHRPIKSWPFSKARRHWLFDEVDVMPDRPGMFVHRILLSDGAVLEIPFASVLIHDVPIGGGDRKNAPKRTA